MTRNAKAIDRERLRRDAVVDNGGRLLDINRRQIRHGVNATGQPMRAYRSKTYAKFKVGLSSYLASFPTPDLFLTGAYQESMRIQVTGSKVEVSATDQKAIKLERYKALGFNDNAKNEAVPIVNNQYVKDVADALRK